MRLFCGCKCVYFVDPFCFWSAFILWILFAFGMFLMLRFSNFQKHKQAKTKYGFFESACFGVVFWWCFGFGGCFVE